MTPPLTLEKIRQSPKLAGSKTKGVADFVSEEEVEELREAAAEGRSKNKIFDGVDAFCAEILARFGVEVYERWNRGDEEFSLEKMVRFLAAERARERGKLLALENIIALSSTISVSKKPQKTVRSVEKILKQEEQLAKGES